MNLIDTDLGLKIRVVLVDIMELIEFTILNMSQIFSYIHKTGYRYKIASLFVGACCELTGVILYLKIWYQIIVLGFLVYKNCMPITFNNPLKVCFRIRNILLQSKQIRKIIFLIKKLFFNGFLNIITAQN